MFLKVGDYSVPRCAVLLLVADSICIAALLAAVVAVPSLVPSLDGPGEPLLAGLSTPMAVFGAVAYALIVLMSVFAMGGYERRYIRGRVLWESLAAASILSCLIWLAVFNIGTGHLPGAAFLPLHFAIFATMGLTRSVATKSAGASDPTRVYYVGGQDGAAQFHDVISRFAYKNWQFAGHALPESGQVERPSEEIREHLRNTDAQNAVLVDATLARSGDRRVSIAHDNGAPRVLGVSEFLEKYAYVSETGLGAEELANAISEHRLSRHVKHVLEPVLAGLALFAMLPLLFGAAIAIKLDDRGPILYSQRRVGKDGRIFSILKFRSMRVDAESDGQARWAQQNDCRITRVGRILRKSRIDEIPQLLNVLKGDMSLVGPRPERPEIVAELGELIQGYHLRHHVRPGLTGWAQINYPYGASVEDAHWKTRYDLFYIKNWSLLLDLAIAIRTVRVVLLAEGSR